MKTFEQKVRELRTKYPNNQDFGREVNWLIIETDIKKKESDKTCDCNFRQACMICGKDKGIDGDFWELLKQLNK